VVPPAIAGDVRVTQGRIETWIDDEKMADLAIAGRRLELWSSLVNCTPFGLASYETKAAFRNIRLRLLD